MRQFRRNFVHALFWGLAISCGGPKASGPEVTPASQAVTEKPAENAPASAPVVEAAPEKPKDGLPVLRFEWTPVALTAECERVERVCDNALADIVAVPDAERTFMNTIEAFEQVTTDYNDAAGRLGFMKDVHPDEAVRMAAAACEERAGKYGVRLASRKDIYAAFKGYQSNAGKSEALGAEAMRLLELDLRDFHRNGLDLADADRQKLVALRERLTELQTRYARNLDEDNQTIEATVQELDGVPAELLARLAKGKDGKLVVTTKYPDYYPVMDNAKNEQTRRRMQVAFMSRGAKENTKLLEEAVALRDQAARLLGYKTHADFATEPRMAKSAKQAVDFEARMRTGLKPRLTEETQKLVALKALETKQKKPTINAWDWRYFLNQLKKKEYAIDDEALRAYFPADKVMQGMFEVYSTLLGVKLAEVVNAPVWAPGVKLYDVRDEATDKVVARFYVDLYPRPGKYGHAACFPVGAARMLKDGYQIPLSVLVVNFNPPANESSRSERAGSRLSVREVTTLFHEFGHVMHASLTTARYASLSGTNVATDFVEAPSQMLENWVFQPVVLNKISSDAEGQPLPEAMAKQVIAARKFDVGVHYSRQVFLGTFDLDIHTAGEKVDAESVARKRWLEIVGFPQDKDEHFAASFGHMMGGYDAGYYGYLWSEVFSADMFARFEKDGVLNQKTGREYRDIILARGRSEDADKLLEKFLGRPANEEAFLRQLGIKARAAAAK